MTAEKTPKSTAPISSRIKPHFVDVKPARGEMTVAESEVIMSKYGLRPMTANERKTFAKFLQD